MLRTYVNLAGGDDADAAAVYLALETQSAKTAAITVLAERKLSPKIRALFAAILKVAKSAQKDRDKLAHWVWGTISDLPDAILLADPRNLGIQEDKIFVYKLDEFEKMRERFDRIAGWGMDFKFIMTTPEQIAQPIYEQLCREPEIAEILARQDRQD